MFHLDRGQGEDDCASAATLVYLRRGPDGGLQKMVLPRGGEVTPAAGR